MRNYGSLERIRECSSDIQDSTTSFAQPDLGGK